MAATELSKSMNEFLTKLQDDLKEAMNTMMCTKCDGKHKYVAAHSHNGTPSKTKNRTRLLLNATLDLDCTGTFSMQAI